uniref:Dynein light intermediate chain n=1 Tax=Anopheles minimus TaxID=112268 RepID=A0A182WHA7_9DIPT
MSNRGKDAFWTSILSEVLQQRDTKLPSNKSLLVLGANGSGKTSLVEKLRGVRVPQNGSGLEYTYINVQNDEQDDVTRLSVWILEDDPAYNNLLKFALNEESFSHTLVLLTVSMSTPWNWMDQLQYWTKILTDHVAGLKITAEEKEQCQTRLTAAWQNYCETTDGCYPGSSIKRIDDLGGELALPLPKDVLKNNLGLDIIVVVTKTDYMSTLEQNFDFRYEHFCFMQQCIRRFCLLYGATIFYTSVKDDKNCDLLFQYIKHRIFGLPFGISPIFLQKDAVLIPAGWDNMNKIDILNENLHSWNTHDNYNDIITQPAWWKTALDREIEIHAEDEQTFLQQQMLQQDRVVLQSNDGPKSSQGSINAGAQDSPNKSTRNILENFFKTLMVNKSVSNEMVGVPDSVDDMTGAGASSLPLRSIVEETADTSSTSDQTTTGEKDCTKPSTDL